MRRGARAPRPAACGSAAGADKNADGITLRASHLPAVVEGLEGIDAARLPEIAQATERRCTLSNAIRAAVAVTAEVRWA